MAIESASDLAGFFGAEEFGTEGLVSTAGGVIPVSGIIDTEADIDRPGGNSRSSSGPFMTGAADVTIQRLQYLTQFLPLAAVRAEDNLSIAAGPYAGEYRIKDIQRDGEIVRLILNKR